MLAHIADLLLSASAVALVKAFIFAPIMMSVTAEYQISRSLRLRSSSSTYLSRTFSAAPTTRTKCHIHFWMKRSVLNATNQTIYYSNDGSTNASSVFFNNGVETFGLQFGGTASNQIVTTRYLRDTNAWYCIDIAIDTTQATAADRVKMWVNGEQVTSFSAANYPAQNASHQFMFNNANNRIGGTAVPAQFFDGYLADFFCIDGTPMTAADFGEADANGNWQPKAYTGAYGTNGFRLDFSDNSGATATALGADRSGNGNNWTPTNISVTAGINNDSFVDTPTPYGTDTGVGGEVRGNYATFNQHSGNATHQNGSLRVTGASSPLAYTSLALPRDVKTYWEVQIEAAGSADVAVGICPLTGGVTSAGGYGWGVRLGRKWENGAFTTGHATGAVNDITSFAYDPVAGTLDIKKNNTAVFTISSIPVGEYFFSVNGNGTPGTDTYTLNCGQRAFVYTAPSGYKAYCMHNQNAPAIAKPSQYFNAKTYTGNNSTQSITGVGHQPDLLWLKARNQAYALRVQDNIRSVNGFLSPNDSGSESDSSSHVNNWLSSVDADGFSFGGATSGTNHTNGNGDSLIAYSWKEGVTQGIELLSFTAPASGNHAVAHSLGVIPAFVIVKCYTASSNWNTWHKSFASASASYLQFNLTNAVQTVANIWGTTGHTSTNLNFLVGSSTIASQGHVAYAFAEINGFSKFGRYTGNGSTSGPFTYCGFRPRFVMIKRYDNTGNWQVFDAVRASHNVVKHILWPNLTNVETSSSDWVDFYANGFRVRNTTTELNVSGGSFLFAAFAESPFNYARAR